MLLQIKTKDQRLQPITKEQIEALINKSINKEIFDKIVKEKCDEKRELIEKINHVLPY